MPGQIGPGSNGNEGVFHIPQGPSITGTSTSDCLVSYPGHLWGGGVLPLCRVAVSVFYTPTSQPTGQDVCCILCILCILAVMYIGPCGIQISNVCSILRGLGYKVLHLFFLVSTFNFFRNFGGVKGHYICICISFLRFLFFLFVYFRFP